MSEREDTPIEQHGASTESAGRRGTDDRRGTVRPENHPAPRSPAPDEEAVRKGRDVLDRV